MTETEWMDIFAGNLLDLMRDRGYNQAQLADSTGLSQSSISKYLRRSQIPTVRAIVNIAYELDCDVNELMDFGDRIES